MLFGLASSNIYRQNSTNPSFWMSYSYTLLKDIYLYQVHTFKTSIHTKYTPLTHVYLIELKVAIPLQPNKAYNLFSQRILTFVVMLTVWCVPSLLMSFRVLQGVFSKQMSIHTIPVHCFLKGLKSLFWIWSIGCHGDCKLVV